MRRITIHQKASYLRDSVFAASDGIITTFAVVAGAAGASLSPSIVVILGFANLFADGFSMSSGTYLGVKSELEYEKARGDPHVLEASPFRQALVSFLGFDVAGLLPLLPYLYKVENPFLLSICLVFVSLFVIGAISGRFTQKGLIKSGFEMLGIGGLAAFVAFITGFLVQNYMV